ncbi:MAG: UMP kinase [Spirochaetaceae bacterium]|jgi:uridylate kinase|nr:UMP kinase [Spirochaetaceae bacterium]
MVTVISLGGSIVAPDRVDEAFLREFVTLIREFLESDKDRKFIFVTGGGGPARAWQTAYRNVAAALALDGMEAIDPGEADWIGVMATRLNAQLVKAVFGPWCKEPVVTNPTEAESFTGRVLVAAGWKPGFSSDYDATLLAEKFGAKTVINLSNIEKVYTDDPRKNPDAKPIDRISWADFRSLVGDEWTPGKNVPFDPVASRHAEQSGLTVICAAGKQLANLKKLLSGGDFTGTTIS